MRSRNRRAAGLTALALAGLAAIAVPVAQANAEPTEVALKTLTWNIEGGYNGSYDQQVDEVVNAVEATDPDFLVVNELCSVQYDALKERLVDNGWTDARNYARFANMDDRKSCMTGDYRAMGFGLFSKYELNTGSDQTQLYADPWAPEGRKHFLTCVTATRAPDLRMCGTHLTTNTGSDGQVHDGNIKQVTDLQEKVSSYLDDGQAVIVGGDFNAAPHWARLNRLYSANVGGTVNGDNTGAFRELDDNDAEHCLGYGAPTIVTDAEPPAECPQGQGVKIDLTFASEAHLTGDYSADVIPVPSTCDGPCSDHSAVSGRLTMTV